LAIANDNAHKYWDSIGITQSLQILNPFFDFIKKGRTFLCHLNPQ
jgi:hypothetical protein